MDPLLTLTVITVLWTYLGVGLGVAYNGLRFFESHNPLLGLAIFLAWPIMAGFFIAK